jgi:hypothetical protein
MPKYIKKLMIPNCQHHRKQDNKLYRMPMSWIATIKEMDRIKLKLLFLKDIGNFKNEFSSQPNPTRKVYLKMVNSWLVKK